MPGKVTQLNAQRAVGWATHPRLAKYAVLVNVGHRSLVARSTLADRRLFGADDTGGPQGHGFVVDIGRLGVAAADLCELRFVVGETDERLPLPDGVAPGVKATLTVEDILALAHAPRGWVTGETYVDAAAAGLRTETIVDMLYRDYLGRPSDPNGLAHYTKSVNAGSIGYDDIRRSFVEADEFCLRRKYSDNAPGSIFSQKIVISAAVGDHAATPSLPEAMAAVDVGALTALDGAAFVGEVYRQLLQKEADAAGMAHYLHQIGMGVTKLDIIRRVASELEAITLGVHVVGLEGQELLAESHAI